MISVIVPVYNVEKYLDECVQSIMNQTYTDFELILVDDGSTDKSGNMCDEYAQKASRVRVIHKKNGGPSEARNMAAIQAKGEYITFIDSDDYVTEFYLSKLINALDDYNADISAVLMTKVEEGQENVEKRHNSYIIQLNGNEALLNVLYQKDLDTTPCGMLFRKSIVLDNPFPVGRFHEDDFTMYKYFENARNVVIVKSIEYFYVQHDSSIMHKQSHKILIDEVEASENLEKYFANSEIDKIKAAKSKKFSNYCQILLKNSNLENEDQELYRKIVTFLKNERKTIVFDKNTRMKNKVAALLLCFGIKTFRSVGKIVY